MEARGQDPVTYAALKGLSHYPCLRKIDALVNRGPRTVDNDGETPIHPAAKVWAAQSGIVLTAYTDRPGIQFYTGNYIPNGLQGKEGAVYNRRQALCLETQAFPDAPHHASFPSTVLKAGKEWVSRTLYRFGVE